MQTAQDLSTERTLSGGFYTSAEVVRMLGMRNPRTVREWLKGDQKNPVILRQYRDADDLGFWDLIEVRFVDYFRREGVSMQHLRKAAVRAREKFSTKHPFALSQVKFKTDRKSIFAELAHEDGVKELEEMTTGQLSFYELVEEFLAKGVEFDATSGLARRWQPEPSALPVIVVDPKIAHGQPSVEKEKVPTRALFLNWKAEGFSYSATSDWFEVSEEHLRQAVEYEMGLGA